MNEALSEENRRIRAKLLNNEVGYRRILVNNITSQAGCREIFTFQSRHETAQTY